MSEEFTITIEGGTPHGAFTVTCDKWCQPNGSQERRVLGQILSAGNDNKLTFTVKSLGAPKTETFTVTDDKGKTSERTATSCEADAALQIGATTLKIKPRILFSYNAGARVWGPSAGVFQQPGRGVET